MSHKLKTKQHGDTIVEVLIAIAVVSSVLGIAYATMNRNLQIIRGNQERTEATRLAQGQIEALKSIWGGSNQATIDGFASSGTGFCVINRVPTPLSGGSPTDSSLINSDNLAGYGGCLSSDSLYAQGIKRQPNGTYKVYVRWQRLGSIERNEVTLSYRLQ